MSHKWNFGTPEQKYKQMIRDYRNGMSIEAMRIKYDYSSNTAVRHVLRKQGELPQAPGRWAEKPLDVPKVLAHADQVFFRYRNIVLRESFGIKENRMRIIRMHTKSCLSYWFIVGARMDLIRKYLSILYSCPV